MELETGILQDICDQIAAEIDAVVTIFGSRGRVVASSKRERISSFHERAAKIMAGEIDSVSVTAEEAAASSTMLEGCTSSIDFVASASSALASQRRWTWRADTFESFGSG